MGNEQQNEGKLEQVRGDVKSGVGDATGNDQMKSEGEWDKIKGDAREAAGDVREGIDKVAGELKHDH